MSNKYRDHVERRYNSLINALRLFVHYNADMEHIEELERDLKVYGENFYPALTRYTREENPVIWIIWQLLVCMYGDYGTSPRAGWITDLTGAIAFLDELKGGKNNEHRTT